MYDEFRGRLLDYIAEKTVIGDPFDLRTTLGPIGSKKNHTQTKVDL